MTSVIVLALAALVVLLVIADPKYGLFVRWRKRQNKKFTEDYSFLNDGWQRLYDEFRIWADKYKKRCNQSDRDNEQENFLRFIESALITASDALTVAYKNYPWRYPFFWKRYRIYRLLAHVGLILEMCDGVQEIYRKKYGTVK